MKIVLFLISASLVLSISGMTHGQGPGRMPKPPEKPTVPASDKKPATPTNTSSARTPKRSAARTVQVILDASLSSYGSNTTSSGTDYAATTYNASEISMIVDGKNYESTAGDGTQKRDFVFSSIPCNKTVTIKVRFHDPASTVRTMQRFVRCGRSTVDLGVLEFQTTSSSAPAANPGKSSVATAARTARPPYSGQSGIDFVWIPPGSFMMGSANGDADERPVHQVTINYSFYMGKYEVTQAQWERVMGNNPSNFKNCGGNCPVENVTWSEAQEFIKKLNEMNDGYSYRLPSEAEWEYVCRAGTTGEYAGDVTEMGWFSANSGKSTHAVGQRRTNAWGLADMHGNVMEWCEDWKHDDYNGAPTDGSAWLLNGKPYRVLRGGSWDKLSIYARSARRASSSPEFTYVDRGFRVVTIR